MQSGDPAYDTVRQFDKDRFLATLFAPESKQPDLFSLMAFSVEIARVPQLVSEPQIGEIRLQWWHETIDSIYRHEPQDHPLASALAQAIRQSGLPKAPLLAFIEAHRFNLYADCMPSLTDLEGYLGQTYSALIQLTCLILSPTESPKAAEAAGYAGVAYGLARHLLDFPKHKNILPPGLEIPELLDLAKFRSDQCRNALRTLPAILKPAFLASNLAPLYIDKARKVSGQIESQGFTIPQWRRQLALWRLSRQ
jgi:15-cis-phytoene synthase